MGNEVPLKQKVMTIIAQRSEDAANRFNRSFFHPERTSYSIDHEIRDLNSFWRRQLAALAVDTLSAREALIDDVPVDQWLAHFESDVVPVIVSNWLWNTHD